MSTGRLIRRVCWHPLGGLPPLIVCGQVWCGDPIINTFTARSYIPVLGGAVSLQHEHRDTATLTKIIAFDDFLRIRDYLQIKQNVEQHPISRLDGRCDDGAI